MNSDFDDNFGGPPDSYALHPGLDPLLIMLLIVFCVVLAGFIALVVHLGRQRGLRRLEAERRASAEAIYMSVRFHLDKALQSPGGAMLERGREVADVLEARLGFVLALNARPGKLIEALDKALKGDRPPPPADPARARIKAPLPTESHYLEVWKTLQGLSRIWDDKPRIMALIEGAQAELSERPRDHRQKNRMALLAAGTRKSAESSAASSTKTEMAPPVPDEPEPEPPAPKPRKKREKHDNGDDGGGGKRKGDLPPHKRNMLA